MFGLSPGHLLLIAIVALLVLGPGKLPQSGEALGLAIRNFRRSLEGREDDLPPASPPASPAVPSANAAVPPEEQTGR